MTRRLALSLGIAFSLRSRGLLLTRQAMVLDNYPGQTPYLALALESPTRFDGHHPSQNADGNSTKQMERNSCDAPPGAGRNPERADICATFVEPPCQKVLLAEATLRNRMEDGGRRFVTQPLSSHNQTATKLGVL